MPKLTLTTNQQARVDELLAGEPTAAPVSKQVRNAALAQLVDEHDARARTLRSLDATRAVLVLARSVTKRYGIIQTIILTCYWKVSLKDILYRTERKFELIF